LSSTREPAQDPSTGGVRPRQELRRPRPSTEAVTKPNPVVSTQPGSATNGRVDCRLTSSTFFPGTPWRTASRRR
jgi:hypothetical protein